MPGLVQSASTCTVGSAARSPCGDCSSPTTSCATDGTEDCIAATLPAQDGAFQTRNNDAADGEPSMDPQLNEVLELEAAAGARVVRGLQEALRSAAAQVCPDDIAVWDLPKERVKCAAAAAAGPDLICHAPSTVWRRAQARSRRAFCASAASSPAPAGSLDTDISITVVSEFGLRRLSVYRSAEQLALAILRALPEAVWGAMGLTDARARADGCLLLTTQLHMRQQRAAGRLQCTICGDFCSGSRGLRDHQQVRHRQNYEDAKAAHIAAATALVPYAPPLTTCAILSELYQRRAAEEAAARKALPPLLAAARDGNLPELQRLLPPCASAEAVRGLTDRHGSNALHWAAGGGHVDICEFLVRGIGVGVNDPGRQKDGRNALHWAARNGHIEVCRWLIGHGAEADSRTVDGTTPLHWAVWRGELAVCEYLVDVAGADLHAVNAYGCNAIQWAAQSDCSDGMTMCSWLHAKGLDLRLLNHNGHSAVHKAAVKGNLRACQWLLSTDGGGLGTRHLKADDDGNTPSRMARFEGHRDVELFLQPLEDSAGAASSSNE